MTSLSPEQRETLLAGPAGAPPPGHESNLIDPPNMHTVGHAVHLVLYITAFVCFAIRLYTKAFLVRHIRLSDYMMIIAWGGFTGYFVPAWFVGDVAPGVDQWNITLRDFIQMLYYFRVGSILYGICIFFIKASILMQLLEIFGQRRDFFYWCCHATIWIHFLFYATSTVVEIFSCHPIAAAWDVLISGSCLNMRLLNVVASVVNGFSDLLILVLPQTRIWQLQMAVRRKIAISTVFLFGILACASAITRLAYTVLLYKTTNNIAYYSYIAGLWSLPELSAGIIAGCLPASPRFFQNLAQTTVIAKWGGSLQELLASRSRRRGGSSGRSSIMEFATKRPEIDRQRGPPDQYPLTSFASAPGTIDQTDCGRV